jgi:ribonuclease HI
VSRVLACNRRPIVPEVYYPDKFPATNNIVEYERLVTGLRLDKDLGIRRLLIRGNS